MSQSVGSRFIVRPTVSLLLRRILETADGKLIVFCIALAPIAASQLVHPAAGIAVGALVVAGALGALVRTRLEVTPGQAVVANLLRTYRLTAADIAEVTIQAVNYTSWGSTFNQTHRLLLVTRQQTPKGGWVTRAAFATERKSSDKVAVMAQELARALQAGGTGTATAGPPPSGAASG